MPRLTLDHGHFRQIDQFYDRTHLQYEFNHRSHYIHEQRRDQRDLIHIGCIPNRQCIIINRNRTEKANAYGQYPAKERQEKHKDEDLPFPDLENSRPKLLFTFL